MDVHRNRDLFDDFGLRCIIWNFLMGCLPTGLVLVEVEQASQIPERRSTHDAGEVLGQGLEPSRTVSVAGHVLDGSGRLGTRIAVASRMNRDDKLVVARKYEDGVGVERMAPDVECDEVLIDDPGAHCEVDDLDLAARTAELL